MVVSTQRKVEYLGNAQKLYSRFLEDTEFIHSIPQILILCLYWHTATILSQCYT